MAVIMIRVKATTRSEGGEGLEEEEHEGFSVDQSLQLFPSAT